MQGLGVMLGQLGGNAETVETLTAAIGKTITALSLGPDDALHFTFDDGSRMKLRDDGQSCCESRYMSTDDKLEEYVDSKLLGVTIKDAPNMPDEYGEHEVQFLEIQTSKGVLTMASHNEHNGYYGGFHIVAQSEA